MGKELKGFIKVGKYVINFDRVNVIEYHEAYETRFKNEASFTLSFGFNDELELTKEEYTAMKELLDGKEKTV